MTPAALFVCMQPGLMEATVYAIWQEQRRSGLSQTMHWAAATFGMHARPEVGLCTGGAWVGWRTMVGWGGVGWGPELDII